MRKVLRILLPCSAGVAIAFIFLAVLIQFQNDYRVTGIVGPPKKTRVGSVGDVIQLSVTYRIARFKRLNGVPPQLNLHIFFPKGDLTKDWQVHQLDGFFKAAGKTKILHPAPFRLNEEIPSNRKIWLLEGLQDQIYSFRLSLSRRNPDAKLKIRDPIQYLERNPIRANFYAKKK